MNIRNRLTLRFILIVALIIITASISIYFFSADYRQEVFYDRLLIKATNTTKILIEVDEVDAVLLRRIERDNPVSLPNEKIVVYDYRNEIIFSTDEDKSIVITKDLLDRVRLEEEVRFRQHDYEILGFLFKGQYDRFAVFAAATDTYGFNKLKNLRSILLVVFAVSILLASVSGWIFSGKALQPISKVVKRVDEITITSLDLRVDEGNGKDELSLLAKTFNNMLRRLETSFIMQKNFIANASHELRTPLTAITGQLEVTLINTRSTDEYKGVMGSVLEDIKNLNDLSNKLLLLAQANTDKKEKRTSRLRIDELLWQSRDDLIKRNPDYTINIDFDEQLDDELKLTINGDEQLIKVAIANIMENGCKFSKEHVVNVLVRSRSAKLEIQFMDKGYGIPDKDLSNIFEPFYRGGNVQKIRGHGIGLSMTERIVKLHNGTIHVNSAVGEGTMFIIVLPVG